MNLQTKHEYYEPLSKLCHRSPFSLLTHFEVACCQRWAGEKTWKDHIDWNELATTNIPFSDLKEFMS